MEISRQRQLIRRLIISLFIVLILFPLSHEASSGTKTEEHRGRAEQPPSCIAACLSVVHGVAKANFTLLPHHHKNDDPLLYYNYLLDFSLQNLRFTGKSMPKPIAIILPNTKEQVVKSVLCCRNCSLEIRIRSGGHSYEGISSVANDGSPFVIIDLMKMEGVAVDTDSKTAWVEGGATLGQTYYAISEASKVLGFPAGSCRTVGVGGHISGGGFGLLSRKYGVAADNVVDAVLVDAEGRVLDRTAMGEDVFWAIRGGGGGVWGIVYAWKIKLVEVPVVVTCIGVTRQGTNYQVARLVHKWQKVAPMLENEFYLSCILSATSSKTGKPSTISATFTGYYLGPKQEAMSILNKKFPHLKLEQEDYKEMNWIESVAYFSGSSSISQLKDRFTLTKTFFKAKSDYVKTPISGTGILSAFKMLQKEPKGYIIMDPYGGIMDNISKESIAFPHRKGNLFSIQYIVEWNEGENGKSKVYINWIREFYKVMTPYVSKSPREAYINYMDLDLGQMDDLILPRNAIEKARVWGDKYFLSNYERLVRAKTMIDPLNVFRHQQGIPPMPI